MAEIVVQVVLVLAEKVIIFLDNKFDRSSTNNVHSDVEKARNCLERMKAYLSDYNSEQNSGEHQGGAGPEVLQARVKQVQEIAYEIEDALDKFLLHVHHQFHRNRVSQKVHSFMKFPAEWQASREFSSTINYIMENKLNFLGVLDSIHQVRGQDQEGRPSSSSISPIRSGDDNLTQYGQFLEEEEIMGFEEPKEKLIKQLVEGDTSRPLTIISVVGLGGSGKTTLMKNVFESKMVQQCFDCHAWIDVSRGLSPRELDELLLNMLSKFDPKGKRQEPVLQADPRAQLRRLLEQKRFLVVLDNLWSRQDLEGIINALPNGLPASTIVITTRNSDIVASWRASSPEHFHDLSDGISSGNAWILFCKKAFHNNKGKCPPELEEWARKIVKKCEGLPLAISAVGTLLATKRANPLEWKKLHDSLGSNLSAISQMLQPSYKDLPSHLKTCFLYFSMFPEDYSISRERLIRLWIAEGFVMPIRGARMTMEEVAEGYLDNLIGRNLVHASSREVDGRVRSCRVLNLVLEFITAKVENFITILWEADRSSTTQGEKIRRLSIHNVNMNNFSRGRDLRCTRTLLVCGQGRIDSELERVLRTFKFLRVLDLQGIALEEFPDSVFSLTLLRYISLRRTNIKKVPNSIKKLGFLETLDLKHTLVTRLPEEIFYLHNLRHLLVYRYDVKNYVTFEAARGVEISAGNIGALSSIQKLSLVQVKNNTKILKALGELTSLKKLGLTDLKSEDGRELCNAVEKMENLLTLDLRSTSEEECLDLERIRSPPSFLQRLYLKGRLERLPRWISRLDSVTKIGLKWSKLNAANKANPLEALQALPNLMQLDLVDYCNGEVLEFKGRMFKKLKILNIEQFDQLNTMIVENEAMPMLKKLTMSKCKSLELLPLGINGLRSLDELLLYDMPEQFIAKLQRNSEFREMVKHIRIIHSWHLRNDESFTEFQNLS